MRVYAARWVALFLLAVMVAVVSFSTAFAAKRLALVIGIDGYQTLPKLKLAQADAKGVANALRKSGFDVIVDFDVSRRNFNRRLSDLEARISPGDTVFFFFAGHGVALGPENVLLPVDMPAPGAGEESLVREEGILTDSIVQRVTARGAATTLMVLDACRDNPFAATGTRSIGRSRGLARTEAPRSVFVLYSAGIGQTALDQLSDGDAAANSVFTRNLLPLLVEPGLTHVELAKRVQTETDKLAATIGHQQQPAYYDQIIGDFVLNPVAVEPPATVVVPEPTAADLKKARLSEAAAAWSILEASEDPKAHEVFIKTYGDTAFAKLAQDKLDLLIKKAEPPEPEIKPVDPPPPQPAAEIKPVESKPLPPAAEIKPIEAPPPPAEIAPATTETKREALPDAPSTPDTIPVLAPQPTEATPAPVKPPKKVVAPAIKKTPAKRATVKKARAKKPVVKRVVAPKKRSGANCFTFEGQRVCD